MSVLKEDYETWVLKADPKDLRTLITCPWQLRTASCPGLHMIRFNATSVEYVPWTGAQLEFPEDVWINYVGSAGSPQLYAPAFQQYSNADGTSHAINVSTVCLLYGLFFDPHRCGRTSSQTIGSNLQASPVVVGKKRRFQRIAETPLMLTNRSQARAVKGGGPCYVRLNTVFASLW